LGFDVTALRFEQKTEVVNSILKNELHNKYVMHCLYVSVYLWGFCNGCFTDVLSQFHIAVGFYAAPAAQVCQLLAIRSQFAVKKLLIN